VFFIIFIAASCVEMIGILGPILSGIGGLFDQESPLSPSRLHNSAAYRAAMK
jgi:hypothetical protein